MSGRPVITLTTDFGHQDPFAGVMKGVILSINPDACIVDLTHGISPQDVVGGAFVIGSNYQFFPRGSIHVVVVDPGVGSGRRPLLLTAGDHFFVGPDNGVFSMVWRKPALAPRAVHITNDKFILSKDSPTFQGRDVFAPVAAWLSTGMEPGIFGEEVNDYLRLDLLPNEVSGGRLKGRVVWLDRFGNAITNIERGGIDAMSSATPAGAVRIFLKGREAPLVLFYAEATSRGIHSLINSSGYVEFFVNLGNAAREYSIAVGDEVEVIPA